MGWQRLRNDARGFCRAVDARVNEPHEPDGAAAVVVVDGCVISCKRRDALGGNCGLLSAQLCELVIGAVEVVLPVPANGGRMRQGGKSATTAET